MYICTYVYICMYVYSMYYLTFKSYIHINMNVCMYVNMYRPQLLSISRLYWTNSSVVIVIIWRINNASYVYRRNAAWQTSFVTPKIVYSFFRPLACFPLKSSIVNFICWYCFVWNRGDNVYLSILFYFCNASLTNL